MASESGLNPTPVLLTQTVTPNQVLELSFVAGTSLSVMGRDFLYNEKSNKKIYLPVWDSPDMTYLAARLEIKFEHKQVVLGDESHDLDDPQVAPLVALAHPDSPRSPTLPPPSTNRSPFT